MSDGTNWWEVIKSDLNILVSEVHPLIDRQQKLLNPQEKITDGELRAIAPFARRIDRFVREIGFLGVPPWLDIEYADRAGLDNSLGMEAFLEQLAKRMKMTRKVSQGHRCCVYSPCGFLKTAMPNTVAWQRAFDDVTDVGADPSRDGSSPDEGGPIRLDEVPPDQMPAIDIAQVAQLTPEMMKSVEINDMPTLSNMSTPRTEYVDPRHVVTDPYIGSLEAAYYIAHLVLRTPAQVERQYGYKEHLDTVEVRGRTEAIKFGNVKLTSFRPMTNQKLAVLAEVYVRQDPSKPEESGLFGVIDMVSGKWILPLDKLAIPNRWTVIRADDTHPLMWFTPSYISFAWDDMKDRAWVRRTVREHAAWSASDAMWIPESVVIDDETTEEIASGNFTRRIIRYGGPRFDPTVSHTRQFPTSLVQMDQLADQSFSRNTGATSTSQGSGESNKVATAFVQEASFMDKRQSEIMGKLYDAYMDVALIATWLIMQYGSSQFVVTSNGISFTMDRDSVSGIANYTMSAVNRAATDPLAGRLMMVQQLKELFANPVLLQHFDPKEVSKLIAALNGWPSRVLSGGDAEEAGPGVPSPGSLGGGTGGESGTSARIGDGVDSAGAGVQDSVSASAGATNRGR